MNCHVNVYAGAEPYVYLINSRRDDGIAFPLVERLAKKGLRIWHDADVRNNQSAWKSTTSQKLNGSSAVLVLLSQSFAQTHICRRQLTDAIENKKPVFIVRLDKPTLTLGMKLQIEASTLLDCSFPPADTLVDTLLQEAGLRPSTGAPQPDIEVQAYRLQVESPAPVAPPAKRYLPSDQTIFELVNAAPANREKPPQVEQNDTVVVNDAEDKYDTTVVARPYSPVPPEKDDPNDKTSILRKQMILPVILSMSTGTVQKGLSGETVIGRQARLQTVSLADIRFAEQSKLFSRRHFKLICIDKTCTLVCLHENGLSFNGLTDLPPNEPTRAEGPFVVEVPGKSVLEQFSNKDDSSVRFVIAYGTKAKELWEAPFVATLESVETGEIRAFWHFPIMLGRKYPWSSGAMSTATISSDHASILLEDGRFILKDTSKNGTIINEDVFCNHKKYPLTSGTVLRINGKPEDQLRDESFIFRFVKVERANEV